MANLLKNIVVSARPTQWLKNAALYAALIFSGNLLDKDRFILATTSAIIFSILSSGIYFFNDIIDASRDRLHPYKKLRPIASGKLPIPLAIMSATIFFFVSLFWAANLSIFFFLLCLSYLIMQFAYTLWLKNIAILDVLIISAGFIIRVYAGALILNVHLSVWFLLCVISTALFLSVGKRRSELAILTSNAQEHRRTLGLYPVSLLDDYLSIFASSSWISWALFTFFEPPLPTHATLSLVSLPQTFAGTGKWLMITIPVVVYVIMRYLKIIYEGEKAESPDKALLSDRPLLISVLVWAMMIVLVLYAGEF